MERRIEIRQLINILTLFLIVQFGGLLLATYSISTLQPYVVTTPPAATASAAASQAIFYAIYIVIMAMLILILFRFYHGNMFFVLLEAFVIWFSSSFVFYAIAAALQPSLNPNYALVVAAVFASILVILKNKLPKLRNLAAVISSMGVGMVIGFNGFTLAYFLITLMAVYDYIAVFVTKHMITLAKHVSSRNMAFLIGSSDLEVIPSKYMAKSDVQKFRKSIKNQKIADPMINRMIHQGKIPILSQVQLGTGDLALPLTLVVGAYASFLDFYIPVMIIIGSALGLFATMLLLKKYKVALPAIPPLLAFINLALAVVFLTKLHNTFIAISLFVVFLLIMWVLMRTLEKNSPDRNNNKQQDNV